jgi:hypothetical protein
MSPSLSDMIFACVSKVYAGVSARRFASDCEYACEKGFLTRLPHYNSIQTYLESEQLTPILLDLISTTARPLAAVDVDFAVDSTGFTTRSYVRHFDVKYRGKDEKIGSSSTRWLA